MLSEKDTPRKQSPADAPGGREFSDHGASPLALDLEVAFPHLRAVHNLAVTARKWTAVTHVLERLASKGAGVERLLLRRWPSCITMDCHIDGVSAAGFDTAIREISQLPDIVSVRAEQIVFRK